MNVSSNSNKNPIKIKISLENTNPAFINIEKNRVRLEIARRAIQIGYLNLGIEDALKRADLSIDFSGDTIDVNIHEEDPLEELFFTLKEKYQTVIIRYLFTTLFEEGINVLYGESKMDKQATERIEKPELIASDGIEHKNSSANDSNNLTGNVSDAEKSLAKEALRGFLD